MSATNPTSTKVFVSIALMSAMISAAATYSLQGRNDRPAIAAASSAPSHVIQPTPVSSEDALAEGLSWVQWPSLTDF